MLALNETGIQALTNATGMQILGFQLHTRLRVEKGMDRKAFLAELKNICGERGVLHEPADLIVYEYDGSVDGAVDTERPMAAVLPTSTEQVSAVVRLAWQHGVPVVARGAGTGLSGGAVARGGGIIIALTRMDRMLRVDPVNRTALVEPGVINLELSQSVHGDGMFFAPDPSSQKACTIGGNVAENSGGPHCLKYGVTTRYITGLTVVLPDGEVVRLGGQGREAATLDLVGLFVGSEGCFGLATEVEVALVPLPEGTRTLLAIFETLEDAGRAVTDIISRGLLPA